MLLCQTDQKTIQIRVFLLHMRATNLFERCVSTKLYIIVRGTVSYDRNHRPTICLLFSRFTISPACSLSRQFSYDSIFQYFTLTWLSTISTRLSSFWSDSNGRKKNGQINLKAVIIRETSLLNGNASEHHLDECLSWRVYLVMHQPNTSKTAPISPTTKFACTLAGSSASRKTADHWPPTH